MDVAMHQEVGSRSVAHKGRSGKYLTFFLGHEEYGLEILKVREIMGVIDIISIPNVPAYVKGVINLRGNVIPIVDLRLKFHMEPRAYDKETCIIVVNMHSSLMGIAVDTVSEVLDIVEDDIDDSPNFGGSIGTDFILGMGKVKGQVKILLDLEKVLTQEEVESMPLSETEAVM